MTEYELIEDWFRGREANRSGLPYMQHINHGLYLLGRWDVDRDIKAAWCLHPLLQSDEALKENRYVLQRVCGYPVALALEYRNVANAYTSRMPTRFGSDIRLSPIKEVNTLLRADKIQNYIDARKHVIPKYPEDHRLHHYFMSWLSRLGVAESEFFEWEKDLQLAFPINPDADTLKDVVRYYHAVGSDQIDCCVKWVERIENWGTVAGIKYHNNWYTSAYVFASHRGRGHYTRWVVDNVKTGLMSPIITRPDCRLETLLMRLKIPHVVV